MLEQVQGLLHHRGLRPGVMAENLMPFEGAGNRLSEQRLVVGQVVHRQDAADTRRGSDDGFGDRTLVEDVPGRLQASQAVSGNRRGRHSLQRGGQSGLDQRRTWLRDLSVVIEHVPAAGRIIVELSGSVGVFQPVEHVFVIGNTVLGVIDGRGQDFVDGHAAVALQKRNVRSDDSGNSEGQMGILARPGGDSFEALRLVKICRCLTRSGALSTERQRLVGGRVVEHEHALRCQ